MKMEKETIIGFAYVAISLLAKKGNQLKTDLYHI